jgi:RAB protein geranylgeranyltransferase component A
VYAKYKPDTEPPASLGHSRDWNVDLVPKFIMACGDMVCKSCGVLLCNRYLTVTCVLIFFLMYR